MGVKKKLTRRDRFMQDALALLKDIRIALRDFEMQLDEFSDEFISWQEDDHAGSTST